MDGLFELIAEYNVVQAFGVNLALAVLAAIGSFVLGAILALFRISPVPSLQAFGSAYVNLVRNTPLTILMVLGILGVWGQLKFSFSSDFNTNFFMFAVVTLSLYHAAFFCEAIRSGVNTVPLGQAEAARAIGLSFLPAARMVIFPQALRGAITPLGNTLIALTKNTTVAAAASVTEASSVMKTMIEFRPDVMISIFMTIAIGFCLIVIPIGLVTTWASERFAVAR
ncbi:amino acid ABC transporter permease [Micrococcoides hystricis]|uniref:Amino acid ABC transporter permease n=1 Tax=Micrococcoides hystricis TaxID=1572761 RepID=A0ABV6P8D9_9MICC